MFVWPKDRLTRFEFARLIGARALQIALGAPVFVKTGEVNPVGVAKEEFKRKIIPITVKRTLPNGEEVTIEIKKAIENYVIEHPDEF